MSNDKPSFMSKMMLGGLGYVFQEVYMYNTVNEQTTHAQIPSEPSQTTTKSARQEKANSQHIATQLAAAAAAPTPQIPAQ